ncbi:hypothetical protein HRI_004428700 [Hibiscus trionum]|uniref:Endonuclease/exonuclease/phosphatase domain-containing protein n=1 Tax=Hibiscus trionum TaxID=183268 RepID=A0A9W7J3T3_HIBTR|nr:hypothetical protein HRI_004428700 [Hibiscus trionum]
MICSFLSWNVRVLGKVEKLRALCQVISSSRANVVFMQESNMERIKPWVKNRLHKCNLGEIATAPSTGASGGLISLWDPNCFKLEKKIVMDKMIGLIGIIVQRNLKVGLINIYALNDIREKRDFFEQLSCVIESLAVPILVGRDFNSVLRARRESGLLKIKHQ